VWSVVPVAVVVVVRSGDGRSLLCCIMCEMAYFFVGTCLHVHAGLDHACGLLAEASI
jgi:hypothetical protein